MLARDLGYPSRARMYADLTAEELVEHEEAFGIDPWGPGREEALHGILCNLVEACHRAKGRPEPALYYMPFAKALMKPKAMKDEDMKAMWMSVAQTWGN